MPQLSCAHVLLSYGERAAESRGGYVWPSGTPDFTLAGKGVVGRQDDCATGFWSPCMCCHVTSIILAVQMLAPLAVDTLVENAHA